MKIEWTNTPFVSPFSVVEREQLAEETPILYRLTVGDSSPSPKNKTTDEVQSPQIITDQQQHVASTAATSADADISSLTSSRTAINTATGEETEKLAQDRQEQQTKEASIGPPTLEVSGEIS